jgi:hypothetical protein
MMNSLVVVKATAAVTVLAAGSYYISAPALLAGFLSSPALLLWVAANVIIIWLLSSFRRRSSDAAADTSSSANDVLRAVGDLYPASDYEGYYSSSGSGFCSRAEAPVAASRPPKRHQVRDATRAAARRTDRARVPPTKKPAGDVAVAAARTEPWESRAPDAAGDDMKIRGEVTPATRAVAARPECDDDVSLDSLWQSMLQRRAVRPVAVRKSETWGNDELPRLQRAAETAAARRREIRKSVSSATPPSAQAQAVATPASAVRQLGWRTRDVLVRAQDDLLRRAESLIRRHHEQLRLQRQESEQRQAMERQRGRQALIRV